MLWVQLPPEALFHQGNAGRVARPHEAGKAGSIPAPGTARSDTQSGKATKLKPS